MGKLESIRADLARSLAVRLKRVDHVTGNGNRTGSLVELEGAQKDVKRAQERLGRAQVRHAVATAEVQEYADALKNNGGTPELPEGFTVYVAPEQGGSPADDIDGAGNPTDLEREPEPNDDDDDDDPDSSALDGHATDHPEPQPRAGGRFARRGTQV